MVQFLIGGLPRTGSAWLSRFLTYQGCASCLHEPSIGAATPAEVYTRIVSEPGGWCGSADSLNPQLWRHPVFGAAATVYVMRSRVAVQESLARIGINVPIEALVALVPNRLPDGCLLVDYTNLFTEQTCRRIWAHCLPGLAFDLAWWRQTVRLHITVDPKQELHDLHTHAPQLNNLLGILNEIPSTPA